MLPHFIGGRRGVLRTSREERCVLPTTVLFLFRLSDRTQPPELFSIDDDDDEEAQRERKADHTGGVAYLPTEHTAPLPARKFPRWSGAEEGPQAGR